MPNNTVTVLDGTPLFRRVDELVLWPIMFDSATPFKAYMTVVRASNSDDIMQRFRASKEKQDTFWLVYETEKGESRKPVIGAAQVKDSPQHMVLWVKEPDVTIDKITL